MFEYHIDASLKYTIKADRGVGCFCCYCHWYCCCVSSLGTGCFKTSSAPPMTKLMCRLPGKRLKEMDFRKAFKKKDEKKWIIKMELTFPSWGWAHSRQSCWWTRDSTWVIVQNSWGRKIVGSNVKMCDSCWRDSAGADLTWQGYSSSRQSWWTGHQEAWVEVVWKIQIKNWVWVGTCLNVPMIASFRKTRSSW